MTDPRSLPQASAPDTHSGRRWDVFVLLMGLAPLSLGCDSPDRVMVGESVMADSAHRGMLATDFEAPVDPDYLLGLLVPPYPPGVERLQASLVRNEQEEPYGLNTRSEDGRRRHEWALDFVRARPRPGIRDLTP